ALAVSLLHPVRASAVAGRTAASHALIRCSILFAPCSACLRQTSLGKPRAADIPLPFGPHAPRGAARTLSVKPSSGLRLHRTGAARDQLPQQAREPLGLLDQERHDESA